MNNTFSNHRNCTKNDSLKDKNNCNQPDCKKCEKKRKDKEREEDEEKECKKDHKKDNKKKEKRKSERSCIEVSTNENCPTQTSANGKVIIITIN
jgi:hypothetical protein